MIETLNTYVEEYDVHFKLMQGGRVGVSIHMQQQFIYRYQDNDDIREILYDIKNDNDISFELTKQLKYMLGLGSWVLHPTVEKYALQTPTGYTQLQVLMAFVYMLYSSSGLPYDPAMTTFYGKWVPDMTNGITRIFIYCDEVNHSVVGDTKSQLLGTLNIQWGEMGSGKIFTHTMPPITRDLIKSKIAQLHIKLCDIENNLIQFSAGTVGIECVVE
ncbi:Hypothetical predicted protein [Paramuricea clavata]|uniref:Uncharacterized protein n=1 Tax=Paramuricea clavata TaxID=317549 RepID=A0A7D9DJ22_PARCT|nr:Hypothetical predicted protein [Paramuricea clavata]